MKKHVLSAFAALFFLSLATTGLMANNDPVITMETPEAQLTEESPEALYCRVEVGDATYTCWLCKCSEFADLLHQEAPEPSTPTEILP